MSEGATILTRPDQTRPDQTRPDQLIVRNSSLELLRIIAMLMIIASHFAQHGGFNFPINEITLNRLWWQFMRIGGSRGNDLFVLLTGYFLVNSHGVRLQKMINLWIRLLLYSLVIFGLLILSGLEVFSLKGVVVSVMPVTHGRWWFPKTYFVLCLIHPYLNVLLHSFSRREYEKFIMAIMIYWCVIPTFLHSHFSGSRLMNFMCIYSVAGYFRIWAKDFGNRKFIAYGLLFIMGDVLAFTVLDIVGLRIPYFGEHAIGFAGMMKPFTLLSALCLFLGFRKIDMPPSKTVNVIAFASFGVYLIHENYLSQHFLWRTLFRASVFQDSTYLIPYSVIAVLAVYILCAVIELLRSKVFRVLSGGRLS